MLLMLSESRLLIFGCNICTKNMPILLVEGMYMKFTSAVRNFLALPKLLLSGKYFGVSNMYVCVFEITVVLKISGSYKTDRVQCTYTCVCAGGVGKVVNRDNSNWIFCMYQIHPPLTFPGESFRWPRVCIDQLMLMEIFNWL